MSWLAIASRRWRVAVLVADFVVLAAGVGGVVVVGGRPVPGVTKSAATWASQPVSSPGEVDFAAVTSTTSGPPPPSTAVPVSALSAAAALATARPTGRGPAPLPAGARPLPTPLPEPNRSGPAHPPPPTSSSPGEVWTGDFPDPFVLAAGGTYYAFATQSGFTDVQTIKSVDLIHWQWIGDALPRLPSWAAWGATWGPSVLTRGPVYVLYYTVKEASTGRQCISRATSVLPQGPYVDTSSEPFICQLDRGGSIDPSPFVDADGTPWLQWKSEGTTAGEPTRLWSQRLSADGQQLVGQPAELLHTDQAWEQPIIEGPSLVAVGGRYYLFFSANRVETPAYAVGYAVCATPAGPCHEPVGGPVLASHDSAAGPGGPDVFSDALGRWHLAFHAWTLPRVGYANGGSRSFRIADVAFAGDGVSVSGA